MWFLRGTSTHPTQFLTTGEFLEVIVLHGLLSILQRFFVKESIRPKERLNHHENDNREMHNNGLQMATWGEFQVLVFLLVLAFMEFQTNFWTQIHMSVIREDDGAVDCYYSLVGQCGVFGCLLTTAALVVLLPKQYSLVARMALHVAGPLLLVESCLRCLQYTPSRSSFTRGSSMTLPIQPYCLHWLVDFFLSTETCSPSWPRYFGLLYWLMVLVVLAKPTIRIVHRTKQSVVITRKWFHLVAVVLFAPTTHYFPELMALGYAVALCGLLILESIRREAPLLDHFFRLLQDPTKDVIDGVMLSHICLILGCAIPLWLGLSMEERIGCQMLLRNWGILSLGVGDAMAAVVGKALGRFRWGRNNRTVEGSAAMWISMMLAGSLVVEQGSLLLEVTTLATILEAFTTEMDNLVLPLAGSIWISLRLLGGF